MVKLVIIGAGSGFGTRLSIDALSREPLRDTVIGLCDIHADRLAKVKAYVERIIAKYGVDGEESTSTGELKRSHEYTTGIMEAVVTDTPYRFNGNVMNAGLVSNLPQGSCVEVPCTADARGIHSCCVGDLLLHFDPAYTGPMPELCDE